MNNKSKLITFVIIGLVIFLIGTYLSIDRVSSPSHLSEVTITMENMDEHRTDLLSHRDRMVEEMREDGNYRCCLRKACSYCIEKTPGHGVGATCDCLADIVEGKHPCGECIGEILEGHGNKYLAEYFAVAIAEEVGEKYTDTLREIIFDKYGVNVENQK